MIKITTAFFTGILTIVCGVWAVQVKFDNADERRAFRASENYHPVVCDKPGCSKPPSYEDPPVHKVPAPAPLLLVGTGLVAMRLMRGKL